MMAGLFTERSGELTLSALFVSGLSGFILAYQYEAGDPFTSTVAIDALLPFGSFIRALHFWSSQAFFLLLAWHGIKNIPESQRLGTTWHGRRYWIVLSLTLFLALYTLFSGYILRFDQTGKDAASIAEHLLKAIPLVGDLVNRLLLAKEDEGLNRVYAVHCLFTVMIWLLGTWYHLRRTTIKGDALAVVAAATVLISLLLPAPLDPKDITLKLVKGPWFFLGIQELLRHLPPLLAGLIYPAIPIVAFSSLCIPRARYTCKVVLILWSISYIVLTSLLLSR